MQKHTDLLAAVRRLQWDDVRYFLELARQGSLSGAARCLDVEHSTVARRVEALETSLGLRLFDRLPRSWQLTAEGETLAAQARRIEEEALSFARTALGVSSLEGTVRISAPPTFASQFLVPRLAPFFQRWPGILLEVIGESREANLSRGEADLAIRMTRPAGRGLLARALGELGYGLYATPGYAERPADSWRFLGYDDSLRKVPQQQWLEAVAAGRRIILRTNDLAALHQAARAGLGVAALPHFMGRNDAALVALPSPISPVARRLWLAIHPDVRRSPRIKVVADELAAVLTAGKSLLTGS